MSFLYSAMRLGGIIISLFSVYVYLFPFRIYGFDPRLVVLFIFLIIFLKTGNKLIVQIPKKVLKIFTIPTIIALWSLLAIMYNGTNDISFLIYPFQIIYLFILSYAVFYIINFFHKQIEEILIIKYIIATLILSSIISILMYVNPAICSFFFELQGIDLESRAVQLYFGTRLIGLGCFYFGGGLTYGFGLILVVLLLLKRTSGIGKLTLIILYSFLFVIGIFVARTCLVGSAISFLLLIINLLKLKIKKYVLNVFVKFTLVVVCFSIALTLIYNTIPAIKNNYSQIVDFGFELFVNYFEKGELETDSTEGLKTLYIWPDEMKTYIIGDGRFIGDTEATYYKNTDVGYLRLIYYFGILGMLLLLMQQFYVLRWLRNYTNDTYERQMYKLLFVYILLLNLKGYIDFSPILFLFIHHSLHKDVSYEKNSSLC